MNKKEVMEDVNAAVNIMKNGVKYLDEEGKFNFKKYDSVYPYNNEGIARYYDSFNYDGNVLTVASSGDHMLHAILGGSDDITLFDINKLTKYYCALKLAGAKVLTYEEFFKFFGNTNSSSPNFAYINIYNKIRPLLSTEDSYYWDSLYENGLINKKKSNMLFNLVSIASDNAYYDKEKYYQLQKILNEKNIKTNFIQCDILDLPNHLDKNKTYCSIFLSNISSYIKGDKMYDFVNLVQEELKNVLNENGMVAYGNFRISYLDSQLISGVAVFKNK